MNKKIHVPTGAKVISVLYYIGAVLGIILGLLFLLGAGALESIAEQIPLLAVLGAGLFVLGGIILIALGILGFFIGRGLWKGRNWVRVVAIILACLGFITAIFSFDILGIIIHGIIGGYLLFSTRVKKAFTH